MNEYLKKILVVDDEPDMLDYLNTFLVDNGFKVITATNGRDALDMAVKEKPNLITLDITMPEESGVKAFRRLQELPETKDIPVIIVTGIAKDFEKFIHTRKIVHPPTGYMQKPIDAPMFLKKVNEVINSSMAASG